MNEACAQTCTNTLKRTITDMTTKIPPELRAQAQAMVCTAADNPNPVIDPAPDSEPPPSPFSQFSQLSLGAIGGRIIDGMNRALWAGPGRRMASPGGAPRRPAFMWGRLPVPIR